MLRQGPYLYEQVPLCLLTELTHAVCPALPPPLPAARQLPTGIPPSRLGSGR